MKLTLINLLRMALVTSFFTVGCERAKEAVEKKEITEISVEEGFNAEKMANELWNKIQSENYWANWKKWPDKEAFYKGREPHGALLTTYVNDAALKTIIDKEGQMPSGAIIITEDYMPDKTLDSITVMHKIEGFNPKVNDWFWVKFGPDGKIATAEKYGQTLNLAGKVAACIECHGGQSANDFIFTSPLGEVKKIEKEIFDAEKKANELWDKMKNENYQKTWKMWPGKEAFYEGKELHGTFLTTKEPHETFLTTYVNATAHEAIVKTEGKMPPGAIIIKENYLPDKNITSITVMYKIEGFDPNAFDWFWVKFAPNGKVVTEEKDGKTVTLAGKVASCIECHGKQTSNDYIFTSPLKLEHMY